jgi:hypothetical protein
MLNCTCRLRPPRGSFIILCVWTLDIIITVNAVDVEKCRINDGIENAMACPEANSLLNPIEGSVAEIPHTCVSAQLFGVDRTFVINLDRRSDKVRTVSIKNIFVNCFFKVRESCPNSYRQWNAISVRLAAAGFTNYERFPAIDGRTLPPVHSPAQHSLSIQRISRASRDGGGGTEGR